MNKQPTMIYRVMAIGMAAMSAVVTSYAVGFIHDMPEATNERPLDTPYSELAETFENPFGKIQTGCYWYWIFGNISCDGVVKDLESMKRVGIDRPYIGDVGGSGLVSPQGPVRTFSSEWKKAMQTAFATAARLDMDLGVFNCPGWSMSGGPWVKSEQAMRRFVASTLVVEGPKDGVKLPLPEFEGAPSEDMRDVFAVVYPLPNGFAARIEAKDLSIEDGKSAMVELSAAGPFTAQAAELILADGKASGMIIVEAEAGDGWRKVCEAKFSRVNHCRDVGFSPHAPVIASFASVRAGKFRVTVKPDGKDKAKFSSVALCAAPLVERAFEKSLSKMFESPLPMWTDYKWPQQVEGMAGSSLDPTKAVDLSGKVASDGTLDWKVPEGKWVIYRFGAAPTGTKNAPSYPEATGYEVDKMSRRHVAAHFGEYLGKLIAETPAENSRAIGHAVLDSYEQGGQNFTDGFTEKFKASFGYAPATYLPTLFGMSVASRADSDRFLWDLRRFVADEVAYSYVAGLRKASNEHGLKTWLENYGHWGFPGEFLQYGGQSDEVSGEYWSEGDLGSIENRAAASCAHIYGKRLVWAESHTCGYRHFQRGPMHLKQRTDRFFAEGLNATVLHFYAHQPDDRAPGFIEVFGNEFNRHNTWFDHMDLFTGYLKRCGWMLRQGLNVADIAYFIGEDVPVMTGAADPAPPPGRQFDYINAEVLKETADVDERGRIVLPHGTAYEVLVLPRLETMRPEMVACIERLVNAGAFVLGPKPLRSPSLAGQPQSDAKVKEIADRLWGEVDGVRVKSAKRGKGMIAYNISLEEALKMRVSAADVIHDSKVKLAYAHRTMPNAEIYFVANQSGEAIDSVDVSFRVFGRRPELWDAATGGRCVAEKCRRDGDRMAVTLSFAQHESVFVVFPKESGKGLKPECTRFTANEITEPWTLSFQSDALHRGPAEPVALERLIDLSASTNLAVRHYSGKIVYRTKFKCAPIPCNRVFLNLGEVAVTAKVKVNGKHVGGTCFAPYRLDVTPFVMDGKNDLEIEVCNLWINRLAADVGMENSPTWLSWGKWCESWGTNPPSAKSGLLGPVRIETTELVKE